MKSENPAVVDGGHNNDRARKNLRDRADRHNRFVGRNDVIQIKFAVHLIVTCRLANPERAERCSVVRADPSASAEGWSLSRAMRDHIALTADRLALGLYDRLIEHARRHHAFATNLLDEIASRRRKRLLAVVEDPRC